MRTSLIALSAAGSPRLAASNMRVLTAFQFVSIHEGLVCPADWEEGKDTMAANSDGMKKYLSTH
jgi:peroxiredoxin (alkyl hydroperoxide reductase subunit C)